ncbi:hypothetical protein [Methylobacillus flagellatus]|uniref:hypothetical protein n=1 Tax=Methylobacillus flagellatus TaxID=405 RepID=UPI001BB1250E|nr:hypothetical protein [Methylobacillus flagellatus]
MHQHPAICLIVSLLLSAQLTAAEAGDAQRVLHTPGYQVRITVPCAEGEVSCEQVQYHGISKRSGKAIELTGKSHHSLCTDGLTPCRFLGYVFNNGKHRYFISEDGRLLVTRGAVVLIDEAGQWQ